VHITSVEALDAFRTSLILYVSKARPALEEVSAEAVRVRLWLENDQRVHWEGQARRRRRVLEQARLALSSARMSSLPQASSSEQMAVQRAKRALDEAEAKLKMLKYWKREFDNRVEPLVSQLQKLHTFLAHDLSKATAYLTQIINTLAEYAGTAPPSATATPTADSFEAVAPSAPLPGVKQPE